MLREPWPRAKDECQKMFIASFHYFHLSMTLLSMYLLAFLYVSSQFLEFAV